MRVGVIALLQETNTFIAEATTLRHFEENLLVTGDRVRSELAQTQHETGGFFEGLARQGLEAVPIFAARALPYGTVTDETYDALKSQLLAALREAGPLEGLLLAPHGATVSARRFVTWTATGCRQSGMRSVPTCRSSAPRTRTGICRRRWSQPPTP